jgi:two-component system nitrogen regulation sensor histidine kinase GlnL
VKSFLIITSAVNFLTASLLAFAVVLRGRSNALNRQFGVFALTVGFWSAGYFFWQISEDVDRALFFARALMFPAYFVPVTYLHFVTRLCSEQRTWMIRLGYAGSLVFSCLNLTTLMVHDVRPILELPFWPHAGPVFIFYLAFFAVFMCEALRILYLDALRATGVRASQMKAILIATLIGFPGGATNFPLWYDLPVPPVGNALIFIYLVTVAHAVSRYQLPLVTYDFVHASIYVGLAATLTVIVLLVCVMGAPLVLGSALTSATLLNIFLLGMIVSLFFLWAVPKLNAAVNRFLQQTYLRRRNTQQQPLKELGRRIVTLGSEQEIFENAVNEIARAFGLDAVAVYARTEFDHDYQLRAVRGWTRCQQELPIESVLTRIFQRRMAPVLLDGSEVDLGPAVTAELDSLRDRLPFEALLPIASDDFISGVLFLGARQGGERYTEAELSLLESTCLQIAVTLRARQLERRASQTEKLISLGTLAAGLAHELRNPLTSIQTFTALLREHGVSAELHEELGAVVQRDVNRIASIVDNVAAFAESNTVAMTSVNLPDVLKTVADIVRPELVRTGVELEMPTFTVPPIRGNTSQLLQVFLNLTQNAIQALDGRTEGRISFRMETRVDDVPEPLLFVSVADNGPGIDPAVLPHIFEPFTTTKATGDRRGKHGMGLGLAIVKRIVQHHHGDIDVDSTLGLGTAFRVHLPVLRTP